MALDATTGKGIVGALANGTSYTFSAPYLGLFTTMPGAAGTGGAEPTYPEYCRVPLKAKGIEGKDILAAAATEAGTGDDEGKTVAYVKNQERIYWPDVETVAEDYQETAVGVGLFKSVDAATPYLWAKFPEGNEVVLKLKSVPMVKINNLKLTAK